MPTHQRRWKRITIMWPAEAVVPTIGAGGTWVPGPDGELVYRGDAHWRRRADGKIEASYTPEELALALAALGHEVCQECYGRPPCYTCPERLGTKATHRG